MVLDNWELDFETMTALEWMHDGGARQWHLQKLGDMMFVGHYASKGPGGWQYPPIVAEKTSWNGGYEKSPQLARRFFDLYTDWLFERAVGLEEV